MTTTAVEDRLLSKLQEISEQYDSLQEQLSNQEVASNATKVVSINKELGRLKRLVMPYRDLRGVEAQLSDTKGVLQDDGSDEDMRDLAAAELTDLEARHEQLLQSLKEAMVNDEDAAITMRRKPVRQEAKEAVAVGE